MGKLIAVKMLYTYSNHESRRLSREALIFKIELIYEYEWKLRYEKIVWELLVITGDKNIFPHRSNKQEVINWPRLFWR